MAWYHQYQFVEVTDPMYPKLKELALPIIRYEICDMHILAVEVQLENGEKKWFRIGQVMLYKSGAEMIRIPEQRTSATRWERFLKYLNIKRR